MIHLTPEGLATTLAALVVIAVSMVTHAKRVRRARLLAKYRRGEQDREVQRLKADILEECEIGARRFG